MWTLAGVGHAEPPLRLLIEQVTHQGAHIHIRLNPGKQYLVEIGSEQQFIGHTLVARYKVVPDDIKRCKDCWSGTLESTPLKVTAH